MPKIGDLPPLELPPLHIMFCGRAGTWKTVCAASFPKPFIIDVDNGCSLVLRGLKWAQGVEFEVPQTITEMELLLRKLGSRKDIETLIIDSATTLEDMALLHVCKMNGRLDENGRPNAQVGVREYGKRVEWFKWLATVLLRQKVNTIFICHEERVREDEDKVALTKKVSESDAGQIINRPCLPGKCPDQVPGLMDEVWRFTVPGGSTPKVRIQITKTPAFDAKSRAMGLLHLPKTIELTWGENLWEKLMSFKEEKKNG